MQLESRPEWFEYILTNMKDAVLLTAKNGDLLNANPSAQELLGLELRGGVKIWDAIPFIEENDGLIQLFIDGVMQKRSVNSTVRYVNPEGQHFHLQVTLTSGDDSDGMILVVIHDLTSLTKVHSAFARYTSPEIADYVLSTPEGAKQGGSSREVSILMSDLRGFTAMSTQMSSEDLITMLNHYFEIMAAVIRYFRGTVIEFLGDGIFVVFGAPLELLDHASAAVACAIDMQNAMEEVNAWNREHGYPDLEMGIAVNSGTAVVGNIGSEQKMKFLHAQGRQHPDEVLQHRRVRGKLHLEQFHPGNQMATALRSEGTDLLPAGRKDRGSGTPYGHPDRSLHRSEIRPAGHGRRAAAAAEPAAEDQRDRSVRQGQRQRGPRLQDRFYDESGRFLRTDLLNHPSEYQNPEPYQAPEFLRGTVIRWISPHPAVPVYPRPRRSPSRNPRSQRSRTTVLPLPDTGAKSRLPCPR